MLQLRTEAVVSGLVLFAAGCLATQTPQQSALSHPLIPQDGVSTLHETAPGLSFACTDALVQLHSLLKLSNVVEELKKDTYLTSPTYQAVSMVDASGKVPAGLLTQLITAVGTAKREGKGTPRAALIGEYVLCANLPPKFSEYYSVDLHFPVTRSPSPRLASIKWGLCVPTQCNMNDIQLLVPIISHKFAATVENVTGIKLANVTVGNIYDAPRHLDIDGWGIGATIVLFALIALQIVGTTYDMYCERLVAAKRSNTMQQGETLVLNGAFSEKGEEKESHMFTPKKERVSTLLKLAKCFSINTNAPKLLSMKRNAKAIPVLDGIRFLSMTYVIFGHTYMWSLNVPGLENPSELNRSYGLYRSSLITSAVFAVDSFFLLSGFLTCNGTMNVLKQRKGQFPWISYYLYRFIRLTPAYFLVMLFYVGFEPLAGNGPYWKEFVKTGSGACHKYWWTNMLYINNVYPNQIIETDGCMGWTWYLANDMQFHIISAFLLVPLYHRRKIGWGLTVSLIVVCTIVGGVLNNHYNLYANLIAHSIEYSHAPKAPMNNGSQWEEYIHPYNRIAPYLIGILLADIFRFLDKGKKPMNFVVGQFLILLALANIAFLYMVAARDDLNLAFSDFYNSCSRVMWATGLAVVIYVCHRGAGGFADTFLSLPLFLPLGRLTFSAYLVHPVLLNILYYTGTQNNVFRGDYDHVVNYMGITCLSMIVAFVLTLLVESPLINLTKMVF